MRRHQNFNFDLNRKNLLLRPGLVVNLQRYPIASRLGAAIVLVEHFVLREVTWEAVHVQLANHLFNWGGQDAHFARVSSVRGNLEIRPQRT